MKLINRIGALITHRNNFNLVERIIIRLMLVAMITALFVQPAQAEPSQRGQEAIDALGDRLPEVARKYRRSPEKLRSLLLGDKDLYLDSGDRLLYDCSFGHSYDEQDQAEDASGAASGPPQTTGPLVPYEDTFKLHSLPGASKTIYLDFDGQYVSGTYWNGGDPIDAQPWDSDGNPSFFSNAEKEDIQLIWARVAEDFSPFQINVTTQDPGVEALRKTSSNDTVYGQRVIFTPTCDWRSSCTGVAYIGSFDWNTDTPCWVFHGKNNIKVAAETGSHEAGHTLNLVHDGTTTGDEYYSGHGNWAPIMGASYYKSVSQWSKGEYSYANNTEDDLAEIIAESGSAYRVDDHGNTIGSATLLDADVENYGIIERNTDVDFFTFELSANDTVFIEVSSDWPEGDLDLILQLLYPNGTIIAQSNASSIGTESITAALAAGAYYIRIEGVGSADYSDYASLGQYWLTVQGDITVPPNGTVNVRIAQSADDAEESLADGSMYLNSTDLEFGYDSHVSSEQAVGLRFVNVAIPQGATITSAYLQFTVDETGTAATDAQISVEAADSAAGFTSSNYNVTGRTTTGSTVNWSIPAWNVVGDLHQSPDISTLVQEIVNRSGWTSGSNMVFVINSTGDRTAEAYDGVAGSAPLLHIEYNSDGTSLNVEKKPYLIYQGVNTEMTVLWQLADTQTCTIEWGLDTNYSQGSAQTTEYGSDHQHTYTITGLAPGTMYYYNVVGAGSGSFTTAPADSASAVKFLAYGDTRTYPDDHDDVAAQMINTYTVDPEFQTITLHVGDWIGSDNESDWTNHWFSSSYSNMVEFRKNVPINGCRGNHEGSGTVYEKYYPYPYVGGFYWSFDYGPAHIVILDQYTTYISGSAQYNWLVNDLAASTKPYKFIVLHEPGWSAGGHSNNTTVQNTIQPLCEQYGVQVVLCGHNHYYARCEVNGVQHITTGGGGAPLYSPNQSAENLVVAEAVHHFMEIDIDGDTLTITARHKNGTVLDSKVITTADTTPPTPDPATFAAAPYATSSTSISMSSTAGSDASGPVEYYFTETSGNPGGSDSDWQISSSYTDTSLSPETQYTYTVIMRDSLGNTGSASTPASATTNAAPDTDPPTPNPMTFAVAPYATGSTSISMTATTATDTSGVEYYFTCTSGGGNNSGWQDGTTYEDASLLPDTQYSYTVTARDKSANQNITSPSGSFSATTESFAGTDNFTNADIAVAGTVSGTYSNTHTSDNGYQAITERQSGGKPKNRHSYLEHKWTVNVTGGGNAIIFNVEAHKTANSEADDFVFAYSTDNSNYTDMVTITKTADDNTAQSFSLPASISGTVYIRVRDTNRARGNRTLDTIYIDQMYIHSAGGTPDTTPPTPDPMTFVTPPYATGATSIAMIATTATDESGVQYYFDCTAGGGNDSGWQSSPSYEDAGLSPNTTYTYTVKARDLSSNLNQTGDSQSQSATTDAGCTALTMHVNSIEPGILAGSRGRKFGNVTVVIVDNCGNPVAGADVEGTFTGDYTETITATTDANGAAVFTTAAQVKKPAYSFCVNSAAHPVFTYNAADNVEGCDNY